MPQLHLRVAVVMVCACSSGSSSTTKVETASPASAADRAVINEHAFARLYGVLRWFHPSDEAAALDWNRYASLGVERVRGAASRDDLAAALTALVHPIAPSVVIAPTDHPPPPRAPLPADADQTWWQHLGPGLTGDAPPYTAKRHGRPAPSAVTPTGFGVLMRGLDATPYRGKRIRLRARVAADHGHAQLWLRVDRPDRQMGFFDNMADRPITSSSWTAASIEGPIADDAQAIVFGALQADAGVTRYDDFAIDVAGADGGWTPVAVDNAGFDHGLTGWHGSIPKPNAAEPPTFIATAEDDPAGASGGTAAGKVAVLQPLAGPMRGDEPFTERPNADEVTVVDLGDGLSAWVPLVVALAANRTQPPGDPAALTAALAAPSDPTADHVADVVVAWNVYAHFYPYLDVIGDDWNAVLDDALRDVAGERAQHTDDDHAHVLEHLVARARDGHGAVIIPGRELAAPPIRFDFVEDKVVITASADARVIAGDVVVTIDGIPAAQRLADRAALASGSPQLKRTMGLISFAAAPLGQTVALELDRAGTSIDVTVECGQTVPPEPFSHPAVGEVAPKVWYVDMATADRGAIVAALPTLAAARGVVIDMRGYPSPTSDMILDYIIRKPDTAKWMHIAHLIRPFQQSIAGWDDSGWDLVPARPHLDHVVFMTGPGAISHAESVMGYAQSEGLPIVGAASAGTNGNVRVMELPTGARISFTGMKVTRHDGGQHHLLGVAPTIPAAPTIAGITAGTDEVLDAAIKALAPQSPQP